MPRHALRPILFAALSLSACLAQAVEKASFTRTIFIGDSLTDSGWFRPILTTIAGSQANQWGRFTTSPDLVWSEHLANFYGTDASSRTGFGSGGQKGDNYAIGSARVAGLLLVQPLTTQYQRYLNDSGGQVEPNALYTVWGGANDLFVSAVLPPLAPVIRSNAVMAQADIVQGLQERGARYVLVPNIPDIGLTPFFQSFGTAFANWGTELSSDYNKALYGELASRGLRVIPMDTFSLLQEATNEPALYGFGNTTDSACIPQVVLQSIVCNPSTYKMPDAGQYYLFADGVHPAGLAQQAIADLALSMIEGPRQIAALSQSAITSGKQRVSRVSAQILPQATGESGVQSWLDIQGALSRDTPFDDQRGNGQALLAGLGWQQANFSFGSFAGYGRQQSRFDHSRGDFKQRELSLGAYFGLRFAKNGWLASQLSTSWLKLEVERKLPLAVATRRHQGNTDARNLTAALDIGWDFQHNQLTQGPVIGFMAQRIKIKSFAEDNPQLSTSLAYPQQTLDSQVASIGWQARYQWDNNLIPYLRLSFERELEKPPREVWARAQSITGSLPYAVPGLAYSRNGITATFGLRTQLAGFNTDLGLQLSRAKNNGQQSMLFIRLGNGI